MVLNDSPIYENAASNTTDPVLWQNIELETGSTKRHHQRINAPATSSNRVYLSLSSGPGPWVRQRGCCLGILGTARLTVINAALGFRVLLEKQLSSRVRPLNGKAVAKLTEGM